LGKESKEERIERVRRNSKRMTLGCVIFGFILTIFGIFQMLDTPHVIGLSFFGDHTEAYNGSFTFISGFLFLIISVYRIYKAKKVLKQEIEEDKHKPTRY